MIAFKTFIQLILLSSTLQLSIATPSKWFVLDWVNSWRIQKVLMVFNLPILKLNQALKHNSSRGTILLAVTMTATYPHFWPNVMRKQVKFTLESRLSFWTWSIDNTFFFIYLK